MRRIGRVVHQIGHILLWALVTLLAQSMLWADVPLALKILVGGIGVLSAWRPGYGLLAVAALMPFGNVIATRVFSAYTLGLSEAIVLAFLAGYLVPGRARAGSPPADRDALFHFAVLFGAVVLASCAVQLAIERAWQDHWPPFLRSFARYLATEYLTSQPDVRPHVRGAGFFPPAMLWIEGVMTVIAARAVVRDAPQTFARLVGVAVVAATGAAALSIAQIFEVGEEFGLSPIGAALSRFRFSAAIPSIGPTGSYFMMMVGAAVGLVAVSPRLRSVGWAVAAALVAAAGWLTKSRGPIIAAAATVAAFGTWWLLRRVGSVRWWVAGIAGVVAVGLAGLLVVVNPPGVLRPNAEASLELRQLLVQGSLAMIRAHPAFGVGIKQFRLRYPEFRPADPTHPRYIEDDPHNHFLGVAAELGLAGLIPFVGFVSAAFFAGVRVLTRPRADSLAVGVLAGLVCFAGTWLSHQSLTVPAPAFTFWMLLGALVAVATPPPAPPPAPSAWRRAGVVATAVAIVALAISIPVRASAAIEQVDYLNVQYGFHDWEIDGAGIRFHWTTDHATVFLPREMSLINLPVSASMDGTPGGVEVRLEVNRDHVGTLHLKDEAWHDIRLVSPRSEKKIWRLDLYVTPTWVPSEIGRNPDDDRELGIRVQEPVQRR